MAGDLNADLVRRYFSECVAAVNGPEPRRALALVDELLSADFVMFYNDDRPPRGDRGRRRHQAFLKEHARNYPNDVWTIEELVTAGDLVACQWRIRAIHAASGHPIDILAADFFRIRDGRIAELRRFLDFDSLHRQTHPES